METNRPTITPQGFIGVFIVLLGIVFTLDNLGLVQSRQVLQYWPLAPLGIGLLIVIHASETRDWIRGSVWLGAGALLLARNLGWVTFRIESFWPLLLVFFGLHIIFKAREDPDERIDRRVAQLRRRQERWQRRADRWRERHPNQPMPWGGDWGSEWSKQWTEKLGETDWHQKFHEKFNEDWADKLRSGVQKFTKHTLEHDVDIPRDVKVDVPPAPTDARGTGTSGTDTSGTSSGAGTNATGATGPAAYGASAYGASGGPTPSASGFAAGTPASAGSGTGSAPLPGYGSSASSNSTQRVSMFSFMSGITRRVRGTAFVGGNLTAVMGGIQLDLTQAQLPEDAVIELFAFWGGIEIWVPREWSVVNQGFALMGSIEDKTGNLPQRPGQPRLVLRGMALMGGVEIKN